MKLFALLALAAAAAPAADSTAWPQFRGPESNPISTSPKLPEHWSTKENVEWSAAIQGRGWSSPIVTADYVFLTTVTTDGKSKPPQMGVDYSNDYVAELSKQGLKDEEILAKVTERDIELPNEVTLHYFLYCLDLKSGKTLWKTEFFHGRPPGGRHRKNSFVSETPVTDGKLVYVYVGNMGVYAFDLKGKQVWHTPLESNPIYLDFGTGASPVLYGNSLIVISDNEKQQYIEALDKRTGKQIWRTNRNIAKPGEEARHSAWATPYIWTNSQRTEIVTIGPAAAVSYDLDGKELWRLDGMSGSPIPSPFAAGGMLYVNGGLGSGLFAVKPGAKGDITPAKDQTTSAFVAWSEPRAGTYLPTPVVYNGWLYLLTEKGILSRFDAKSGKLAYKARIDIDAGYFTSSPWAYNGKLFCLSEEGKTFVIDTGDSYKLLHTNPLDEMSLATPAITGDRLLLRTEGHLYSIRRKG